MSLFLKRSLRALRSLRFILVEALRTSKRMNHKGHLVCSLAPCARPTRRTARATHNAHKGLGYNNRAFRVLGPEFFLLGALRLSGHKALNTDFADSADCGFAHGQ